MVVLHKRRVNSDHVAWSICSYIIKYLRVWSLGASFDVQVLEVCSVKSFENPPDMCKKRLEGDH